MKILWLDINSSYSHSSVALPAIHAQVRDRDEWEWTVVRGTINDNPGTLAAEVSEQCPDIIAATFWLFTHRMQIEVLSRVVQLLPEVKIVCGGPEFLGDNKAFLQRNPFITAVIRGEGEMVLPQFLSNIDDQLQWRSIEGLCWIDKAAGEYFDNSIARVSDFASLRYPEESLFFNWDKPFVQLETTRGCFNTCEFCVSGGEKPVRYQSIEQVRERLSNICQHGIRDVRVLDRTFNYDVTRACEMLDLFVQYDGKMRFHLEIHPSLLNDALKSKLSELPSGLLHLEAGIQSLNQDVLDKSGRKGSLHSSLNGLEFLCSLDNVQTHADLIAGLPSYSLNMLCQDIVSLVKMGVEELQIESLKVLPGTQMRLGAESKGLRYSPLPPYEILSTKDMSPADLKAAMNLSRMIDLYYNCHVWQSAIRQMIIDNPDFLENFTSYLMQSMVLDSPTSIERRGVILYEYCEEHYPEMLPAVSRAWIAAGFSLKKKPAGNTMRIKDMESFIDPGKLKILYGEMLPSHRYYAFTSDRLGLVFGYDSQIHQASPVFMAEF